MILAAGRQVGKNVGIGKQSDNSEWKSENLTKQPAYIIFVLHSAFIIPIIFGILI